MNQDKIYSDTELILNTVEPCIKRSPLGNGQVTLKQVDCLMQVAQNTRQTQNRLVNINCSDKIVW